MFEQRKFLGHEGPQQGMGLLGIPGVAVDERKKTFAVETRRKQTLLSGEGGRALPKQIIDAGIFRRMRGWF